jgi:hypothetical protein
LKQLRLLHFAAQLLASTWFANSEFKDYITWVSGCDSSKSMIIADALRLTPAAVLTAGGTQVVFQNTAGGNLVLSAPGSNRLQGQQFNIFASGYAQCASGTYTATIQPILYGDSSLATVTTKPLFSCSAGTLAFTGTVAGAIPWNLSATFSGETLSGTVAGSGSGVVAVTVTSPVATTKTVSTINFATEPPIKFALGLTTGGTLGASPKFVVEQFQISEE